MNTLVDLHPKQWNLLVMPERVRFLRALGELASYTPLIVLDCGRQFDSSIVARAARGRAEVIDRIQVQRAFICFEAVRLLERTPAGKVPVVVLDLLSTFYDENVNLPTRRFLLEQCLRHFQRLSQGGGLAVSVHLPSSQDDLPLFERLRSSASHVATYGTFEEEAQQMSLF